METLKVPIEVSARHIHLSKKDLEVLFGKNYKIKPLKNVSQPNQYASSETVKVKGPKGVFEKVRIIMPTREETQLEISITDSFILGIKVPSIRMSGDLKNTSGNVEIIGPKGKIKLQEGVIVAKRHLHIQTEMAQKLNLNHKDTVSIEVPGERSVIFNNVIVRSREGVDELSFQLDTDEANAAGINNNMFGKLIYE